MIISIYVSYQINYIELHIASNRSILFFINTQERNLPSNYTYAPKNTGKHLKRYPIKQAKSAQWVFIEDSSFCRVQGELRIIFWNKGKPSFT